MHAAGVAASLLALLAANGTSVLHCVCSRIANLTDDGTSFGSDGELVVWNNFCEGVGNYTLFETCEMFEPPSIALPAIAHLVETSPRGEPPQDAEGGVECGAALEGIRGMTEDELWRLLGDLPCHIAADCIDSCSAQGLNDTEWDVETLENDHLRQSAVSQLLDAIRRISRAILYRFDCSQKEEDDVLRSWRLNETGFQPEVYLEQRSSYWRDVAQLLTLGVGRISQLFVPLAYQHMAVHPTGQRLHEWIKNMKRLRDMLHAKLSLWAHDAQSVSEQMGNCKVEEDSNNPGEYLMRHRYRSPRPALVIPLLYCSSRAIKHHYWTALSELQDTIAAHEYI
ncbi:uncharacterized protein LOC126442686 [Schistocerca serialis cubense]|uniref:uncharacterized protein LOC126442686 n=1 Tax=Schistocerca serialis cubense TaxID=2023355 RepID=UPI00214E4A16|nr:uncharacterized protein LOC126442686 [Schistocerca serialis cubense]